MGVKSGTILCNNSVSAEQAGDIIFHLYELSPVETPPESRMVRRGRGRTRSRSRSRGRSGSRGRSESRGRKKPRLSVDALESLALNFVQNLADRLGQDETDSEGEEGEE